jgi:hypothetical protein
MDLKGPYTLLSFRPEDMGLFGLLLTDYLVYVQLTGIFGWSGTPAAFQVVTRAISWEIKRIDERDALQCMSTTWLACVLWESDLRIMRGICTSLLESGTVVDDKTEQGVRLDVIV